MHFFLTENNFLYNNFCFIEFYFIIVTAVSMFILRNISLILTTYNQDL